MEKVTKLLQGMTVDELIQEYLIVFQGKGDPEPDENTTIHPEVIEFLIDEFTKMGEPMGKTMVFLDTESNQLKIGIPFRKRSDAV